MAHRARSSPEDTAGTLPAAPETTGALVKVGYACDQHCIFCHVAHEPRQDASAEHVTRLIDRARALGHQRVVLSGGEPTLRSELREWAGHARGRSLAFGLVTNGQRLATGSLVDDLIARGLDYVHLSLHGPRAVHAHIAGVDGHAAVRTAIERLASRGVRVVVNCVVTRHNLPHLGALARELEGSPGVVLKYSLVEPKGAVLDRFDELVPPVDLAAKQVRDVMDHWRCVSSSVLHLAHDGFPLCLLPTLEGLRSDLRTEGLTMMAEPTETDLYPVDDRNRIHPPLCRTCSLRGACPGLFRAAYERLGDSMLGPPRCEPRSDSIPYRLRQWLRDEGDGCPLEVDGIRPWDLGRDLWVRHRGRVARYHASSRAFADDEIATTKLERGQIYFDAANGRGGAARGLVPLLRAARCARCTLGPSCSGMYEPQLVDVGETFAAHLRASLSVLRGSLLDIDGGARRVVGDLDLLVPGSALRYVGAPSAGEPGANAQGRASGAREAEDPAVVAGAQGPFDHLLAVDCWNRLTSPAAAVSEWMSSLRPGGTLLVADHRPVALVHSRPGRSPAAAESGTKRRRLDGPTEALATLAPFGLKLLERRDEEPGASPWWTLHLARS